MGKIKSIKDNKSQWMLPPKIDSTINQPTPASFQSIIMKSSRNNHKPMSFQSMKYKIFSLKLNRSPIEDKLYSSLLSIIFKISAQN